MKPKLFIDLDGTAAKWIVNGNYTEPGYFRALPPTEVATFIIHQPENPSVFRPWDEWRQF